MLSLAIRSMPHWSLVLVVHYCNNTLVCDGHVMYVLVECSCSALVAQICVRHRVALLYFPHASIHIIVSMLETVLTAFWDLFIVLKVSGSIRIH